MIFTPFFYLIASLRKKATAFGCGVYPCLDRVNLSTRECIREWTVKLPFHGPVRIDVRCHCCALMTSELFTERDLFFSPGQAAREIQKKQKPRTNS